MTKWWNYYKVSRVVTPAIQTSMTPAYEGACNENGTGSYERMKASINNNYYCIIISLLIIMHAGFDD